MRHQYTTYIDEQEIVCTTLADLGEDPLDYMISLETEQRLMQAIDELPARYRLTFTLSRIEGLSYDEIANAMSITKNTVKSNLRDAMTLLREKLKGLIALILLFLDFWFFFDPLPPFFYLFSSYKLWQPQAKI